MKKGGAAKKLALVDDAVEVAANGYASRMGRLEALAKSINKQLDGNGHVSFASKMKVEPFRHKLTGVPALDYVTNGGLLAGNFTEIWGLYRSTKTTLCATIARNLQMMGEVIGIAAIEPFDQDYWRTIGVFIPYSPEEMELLDPEYVQAAVDYNAYYYSQEIIPLTVIHGQSSDHILDGIYEAACENIYDVMFLDSIGEITRSRIAEKKKVSSEVEFGGDTSLIKQFCRFMRSALNTRWTKYDNKGGLLLDKDGVPMEVVSSNGEIPNRMAFVGINQGRVTFNTQAMAQENKYHSPGGEAWKHQLAQSIFLQRIDFTLSKTTVEGTRDKNQQDKNEADAVMIRLKGVKMKGGPEQRESTYRLHIRKYQDEHGYYHNTGELDCYSSLKFLCLNHDLIVRAGNKYSYGNVTFKSVADLDVAMREDQSLYAELYQGMINAARESASTGTVPGVPR